MIDLTRIYYVCFAVLTIAGGIMGYKTKRSTASLIAGSICGLLLLVAAKLIETKLNGALIMGLVVSVTLAGRFIPNYLEKKTPVPGGLMSLLSLGGIVFTLLSWYKK
jgi:uncharacterized membrane protein (UPF0136 family)